MAEALGRTSLQSLVRDREAAAADKAEGVGTAKAGAIAPPDVPDAPVLPEPEVRKDVVK